MHFKTKTQLASIVRILVNTTCRLAKKSFYKLTNINTTRIEFFSKEENLFKIFKRFLFKKLCKFNRVKTNLS